MLRTLKSHIAYRISHIAKESSLPLLSAILLILSFPSFNIWIFAWVGFVPLFFALENKSKGKAFLLAYLTGVIFWWGITYWLVHVTLIGTIILVLYLALYFGLFGYLIPLFSIRYTSPFAKASGDSPPKFQRRRTLYAIASIWVILEYLRAHLLTGFPWTLLGYSQYRNLPIIQIADISGAWGVSFLVVMVNVVIKEVLGVRFWVLGKKEQKRKLWIISPAVLCFIFTITYGYYKLHQTPNTKHQTPIKISVIQGNIPQELKWLPAARAYIVDKHIRLTGMAARENPDLIVWAEAALPAVLEEEPALFERVTDAAAAAKTSLLLGAVTSREDFYYNSALLVSPQGETLVKYNKLHLVPFGEYIPLRKILSFLETVVPIGEISPGKEYTIFELASYPVNQLASLNRQTGKPANRQTEFAVLICFEDLFPELARNFVKRGAQFLVNITNDAWYKKTSAPYQHLQACVFRAVENRVNLARAANTGVSGFIAPSGKIISLVHDGLGRNIFIDGYKTREIAIIERQPTFYTRYGDVFIIACVLFVLCDIACRKIKYQKSNIKMTYQN